MGVFWHAVPHQPEHHLQHSVAVVPLQAEKVLALIVQGNRLSGIDLMGIDDNITFCCLPEDP